MKTYKKSILSFINSYSSFLGSSLTESVISNGLTFSSDLGMKAVVMNDTFEKMNESLYSQISDLFTPNDLKLITNVSKKKWIPRKLKKLYINESDLLVGKKYAADLIEVTDDDFNTMSIPRGIITTFYCRGDVGEVKDGLKPISILPSIELNIAKAIKLPEETKWALALFHYGRKETLLVPIDNFMLSFLTEL